MISTFSHSQSDAISNDCYRARTCHTACSYRVASLRNKHLALKTKEQEMKQRWVPKILLIQDEISLVPAAVENMMLYRSMRARQDEGLDPGSYFHAGELMGRIPILLIAGDFLQIKPANEISLADNLEELVRKRPDKVQTEHYAAQAAFDEHRNSDSLEKVEAIPGCSSARNHNSHANMHACCAFVRGSLGSASHAQNRKLQKRTGDGFLQAWPCDWHVLGEHCPQHGGKGT